MRWSRRTVPSLLACWAMLVACGTNNPPGPASDPASAAATGVPSSELHPLGDAVDVGGLRVRVSVKEVGSDEDGPWLLVRMRVKNLGNRSLVMPHLALRCAEPATEGYMVGDATSVAPGRSVSKDVHLLISDTGRTEEEYYAPIPPCGAWASISVSVTSGRPDYTESEDPGWQVDAASLEQLNAALPYTRPGGEPKDPDRPYAWADGETMPDGYQVVSVPDMTAAEALRIIDPIRKVTSPDEFRRVVVDDIDGGVVLFTHWLIPDRYVRKLSRGGIAASYGNTVNGDDHILVARYGKVVRSFDPFLGHDYVKSEPLPEEKGLDLEYDTWPAAWTLLERLTKIHITEAWVLQEGRPAYLLRD